MENGNLKKPNMIPAILFFGVLPLIFWWFLYTAISKKIATTDEIWILGGFPIASWALLAWLIHLSKKPPKILTPEEKKAKDDKEWKQSIIIGPILLILMMVVNKNYSSWILWTIFGLFMCGWIPYLPEAIKNPIKRLIKMAGWLLFIILLIVAIVAIFQGLASISATNAILLLILWAVLSKR